MIEATRWRVKNDSEAKPTRAKRKSVIGILRGQRRRKPELRARASALTPFWICWRRLSNSARRTLPIFLGCIGGMGLGLRRVKRLIFCSDEARRLTGASRRWLGAPSAFGFE